MKYNFLNEYIKSIDENNELIKANCYKINRLFNVFQFKLHLEKVIFNLRIYLVMKAL